MMAKGPVIDRSLIKNKRFGIYARVSTKDQFPENQIHKLKQYANIRDWDIHDTYVDRITGRKFTRPELDRMKKDIRSGLINGVLVWKIDRLGRSTKDMLSLSDFFNVHNADLVIFTSQIDTSTAEGKFFFTVTSAFAELESGFISERTKLAYDAKKAHADALGVNVRWGRKRSKLSDLEKSYILRRRDESISWRSIADEINDIRMNRESNPKKISYSSIKRIIEKEL